MRIACDVQIPVTAAGRIDFFSSFPTPRPLNQPFKVHDRGGLWQLPSRSGHGGGGGTVGGLVAVRAHENRKRDEASISRLRKTPHHHLPNLPTLVVPLLWRGPAAPLPGTWRRGSSVVHQLRGSGSHGVSRPHS